MEEGPIFFETRAHVLLCTGPRCSRVGSRRVLEQANADLERTGFAYYKDGGSVRLTESGCLGACAHGPTAVAYYAASNGSGLREAWYVGMDRGRVARLVAALHEGHEPPAAGRFDPGRG
jgi:(2Fe-2S) ferredoxin